MFNYQTNDPSSGKPLLSAGLTIDVPMNTILGLSIGIFLAIFLGHFLSAYLKN